MQATLGRKDAQTQVEMVNLAEAYVGRKVGPSLPVAEEACHVDVHAGTGARLHTNGMKP